MNGESHEAFPVDQLVPWENNPRINSIAAEKLAAFIKDNGWGAPIVAQAGSHRVIAGHTRLRAAGLLGLASVPVRFVDVDDRTADRMALADNKLAEVAEWDNQELAAHLSAFSLDTVETMGWDSHELEKLADTVIDFGPLDESDKPEKVCPSCGFQL